MRLRPGFAIAAALGLPGPALALDPLQIPTAPTLVPCPSKGAGFVRLPGSDTCIRISGRVASGLDLRPGHGAAAAPPVTSRLAIDSRADTDLGEVRTYVRIGNGRR